MRRTLPPALALATPSTAASSPTTSSAPVPLWSATSGGPLCKAQQGHGQSKWPAATVLYHAKRGHVWSWSRLGRATPAVWYVSNEDASHHRLGLAV